MARDLRLSEPGRAWVALTLLLAAGSLLGFFVPATAWDWQPLRAATEPWRCWTAAFVHWSERHLAANLAGLLVVGAFGAVGRVSWRSALAWAGAWPLTQLALLLQPQLLHFGGLSGVLHAGVAAAALELVRRRERRPRAVAAAALAGLLLKVLLEEPWGPPLRHPADWDIAVAPLAHATGAVAGLLLGLLAGPPAGPRKAPAESRR